MARQAARLKQLTVFSGKLRRNAISNRETTPRFDRRYEARFAVKESFQIADPIGVLAPMNSGAAQSGHRAVSLNDARLSRYDALS